MGEDEAKTKWCPAIRFTAAVPGVHDAEANRPFELLSKGQNACLCIASACMAWRLLPTGFTQYKIGDGYCGLAGRP